MTCGLQYENSTKRVRSAQQDHCRKRLIILTIHQPSSRNTRCTCHDRAAKSTTASRKSPQPTVLPSSIGSSRKRRSKEQMLVGTSDLWKAAQFREDLWVTCSIAGTR